MKKWLVIGFVVFAGGRAVAQTPLYQHLPGASSRVSSFENLNGTKGQGGKDNATAKGHAFEDLKYLRVEWKANNLNKPSLSAAERLGFVFEGIFR